MFSTIIFFGMFFFRTFFKTLFRTFFKTFQYIFQGIFLQDVFLEDVYQDVSTRFSRFFFLQDVLRLFQIFFFEILYSRSISSRHFFFSSRRFSSRHFQDFSLRCFSRLFSSRCFSRCFKTFFQDTGPEWGNLNKKNDPSAPRQFIRLPSRAITYEVGRGPLRIFNHSLKKSVGKIVK